MSRPGAMAPSYHERYRESRSPAIRMTARSEHSDAPRTVAECSDRSLPTQTFTVFAPVTTWLLVTAMPSRLMMKPEPRDALSISPFAGSRNTPAASICTTASGSVSSDWTNKASDVGEDEALGALDGPGENDAEDEALGALDGPGETDGEDDDPHAAATSATARVVAMIARCRMTFTPSASDDRPESLEGSGTLHGGVKSPNAW